MAISSPLLEDVSIEGATGILINITGGPDLTLHEVNEASSLIQQAAHEDANIIFGSVIDPNLSDEVRITVIATGFDRAAKTPGARRRRPRRRRPPRDAAPPARSRSRCRTTCRRRSTKEYPAPIAAAPPARQAAQVIDEPDIDIDWDRPTPDATELERALERARGVGAAADRRCRRWRTARGRRRSTGPALPAARHRRRGAEIHRRRAAGVAEPERKRAQSRPSMKAVLAGEIDTESELDVPTFIRRSGAHQQ